ncbi:bifunctional riboflavin kinase/FAD synthetase [bacterium]|nr:bifunctional riboflavin kinase/FAD synthetase [bacterium]
MKIYKTFNDVPYKKKSCVTVGSFDGIHLGHKKIIDKIVSLAKSTDSRSVLITFDPIPKRVVRSTEVPELLTTLDEKLCLIEERGVDAVCIIPFDREVAKTGAEEFIKRVVVEKTGVLNFVVGYNHTFGRGAEGTQKLLQRMSSDYDFSIHVVDPVKVNGEFVSSTRIRELVRKGQIKSADTMLGHEFLMHGQVEQGKKLGRELGFPTANLKIKKEGKLIPENGVYAVRVRALDEEFGGMAYIGNRPTLNGNEQKIEVHLHGFKGDLYDSELDIFFLERIRGEKKFSTVDELRENIEQDKKKSLAILLKTSRRY